MTAATKGIKSKSTKVLAGTPAEIAFLIAYLTAFVGPHLPSFCPCNIFSKGPTLSWDFWVISNLGAETGVGCGVIETCGVAEGLGIGLGVLLAA